MRDPRAPSMLVGAGERTTIDFNAPACWLQQAHHKIYHCAFAATRFANKAYATAARNFKVELPYDLRLILLVTKGKVA